MREAPIAGALAVLLLAAAAALAGEPGESPYSARLAGPEELVYVWTAGDPERGIASDSLVTVDARPASPTYGKVIARAEVGSINEAHGTGFTDDRKQLWAGGLDSSRIFVFDVATDPARPRLVRTIDNAWEVTGGLVGPHAFVALPGKMLIAFLSNRAEGSGKTGLAEFTNDGRWTRTVAMPEEAPSGYDARIDPRRRRLLTSSFAGKRVYMAPRDEALAPPDAASRFGDSVVVWDLESLQPLEILHVGRAPLAIRWASSPEKEWAVATTALDHEMILIRPRGDGTFESKLIADVGDIVPVDLSLSPDARHLYVVGFQTGDLQHWDVSDRESPRLVQTIDLGAQASAVAQSSDGRRIYVTSSLLSQWDAPGASQWMKKLVLGDDGKLVEEKEFEVDFATLGRPRQTSFGGRAP